MSTPKVKEELNMPSQLFHIQDHPLIAKSINASGISKELIRRNNRNHTTSTSSNKVIYKLITFFKTNVKLWSVSILTKLILRQYAYCIILSLFNLNKFKRENV